jgi:hypothetical protein
MAVNPESLHSDGAESINRHCLNGELARANYREQMLEKALQMKILEADDMKEAFSRDLEAVSRDLEAVSRDLEAVSRDLEAVYNSNSWKVTAPIRRIKRWLR